MFKFFLTSVLVATEALAATEPVTDEALRTQVLAAAFPGMEVSLVPGKTINATWRPKNLKKNALTFPDAMAHEKVYTVTGKPANEAERCAAQGAGNRREVRLRLYMWPGAQTPGADWLAIVQYGFAGVSPNAQCLSLPLLLHLSRSGAAWKVKEQRILDSHGHTSLQEIRLVDLTGDGRDELVVESDTREDEAESSEIYIFDLTQGRFDERLNMASRMSASVMDQEQYLQVLDVPRSLKEQGKQFCFEKTIYAEEGKWFAATHVSKICYPRGRGVEPAGGKK